MDYRRNSVHFGGRRSVVVENRTEPKKRYVIHWQTFHKIRSEREYAQRYYSRNNCSGEFMFKNTQLEILKYLIR